MEDLRSAPPPPLGDDDHVRGDPAGALVVFYADFTCPRCALAHERLTGAGARVAFRHMALRAKHQRAVPVACAAEAAGAQGAFWPFADALYADQGRLDDPHLWERARALGLDLARFDEDRRGPPAAARVQRDTRAALAGGATTTPTLFVGKALQSGVPDGEWLAQLGYDDGVRLPKPRLDAGAPNTTGAPEQKDNFI
jgi:protein-disulfide isomerase